MPHMAEQQWHVAYRKSTRLARHNQLGIGYENREVDPAVVIDIQPRAAEHSAKKVREFLRDSVKSLGCIFLITRASGKVSMFA